MDAMGGDVCCFLCMELIGSYVEYRRHIGYCLRMPRIYTPMNPTDKQIIVNRMDLHLRYNVPGTLLGWGEEHVENNIGPIEAQNTDELQILES